MKVKNALKQPLNEDGIRQPGEVFEVTAARAKALGDNVIIVDDDESDDASPAKAAK